MLLPLDFKTKYWVVTKDGDPELETLVKRHYSRNKNSDCSKGYIGPGRKLLLRTTRGDSVFGWRWANFRVDNFNCYDCTIFRREGAGLSSDMILEAEQIAIETWGPPPRDGFVTYIDNRKIKSKNPGYCFKKAGWKQIGKSKTGKIILQKGEQNNGGITEKKH